MLSCSCWGAMILECCSQFLCWRCLQHIASEPASTVLYFTKGEEVIVRSSQDCDGGRQPPPDKSMSCLLDFGLRSQQSSGFPHSSYVHGSTSDLMKFAATSACVASRNSSAQLIQISLIENLRPYPVVDIPGCCSYLATNSIVVVMQVPCSRKEPKPSSCILGTASSFDIKLF